MSLRITGHPGVLYKYNFHDVSKYRRDSKKREAPSGDNRRVAQVSLQKKCSMNPAKVYLKTYQAVTKVSIIQTLLVEVSSRVTAPGHSSI